MLKRVIKSGAELVLSATIFGSALYGYIYYQSTHNEKKYL